MYETETSFTDSSSGENVSDVNAESIGDYHTLTRLIDEPSGRSKLSLKRSKSSGHGSRASSIKSGRSCKLCHRASCVEHNDFRYHRDITCDCDRIFTVEDQTEEHKNDVFKVGYTSDARVCSDQTSDQKCKPCRTQSKRNASCQNSVQHGCVNDSRSSVRVSKSRCRYVLAAIVGLLVLGLSVGAAVILAFKVFDAGDRHNGTLRLTKANGTNLTTETEFWWLEGSLDLKQDFHQDLYHPETKLYKQVAESFTTEINRIIRNSRFSAAYVRIGLLGFSPGSIKVQFKTQHNEMYKQTAETKPDYADALERYIRDVARNSKLPIDGDTVHLDVSLSLTDEDKTAYIPHLLDSGTSVPASVTKYSGKDYGLGPSKLTSLEKKHHLNTKKRELFESSLPEAETVGHEHNLYSSFEQILETSSYLSHVVNTDGSRNVIPPTPSLFTITSTPILELTTSIIVQETNSQAITKVETTTLMTAGNPYNPTSILITKGSDPTTIDRNNIVPSSVSREEVHENSSEIKMYSTKITPSKTVNISEKYSSSQAIELSRNNHTIIGDGNTTGNGSNKTGHVGDTGDGDVTGEGNNTKVAVSTVSSSILQKDITLSTNAPSFLPSPSSSPGRINETESARAESQTIPYHTSTSKLNKERHTDKLAVSGHSTEIETHHENEKLSSKDVPEDLQPTLSTRDMFPSLSSTAIMSSMNDQNQNGKYVMNNDAYNQTMAQNLHLDRLKTSYLEETRSSIPTSLSTERMPLSTVNDKNQYIRHDTIVPTKVVEFHSPERMVSSTSAELESYVLETVSHKPINVGLSSQTILNIEDNSVSKSNLDSTRNAPLNIDGSTFVEDRSEMNEPMLINGVNSLPFDASISSLLYDSFSRHADTQSKSQVYTRTTETSESIENGSIIYAHTRSTSFHIPHSSAIKDPSLLASSQTETRAMFQTSVKQEDISTATLKQWRSVHLKKHISTVDLSSDATVSYTEKGKDLRENSTVDKVYINTAAELQTTSAGLADFSSNEYLIPPTEHTNMTERISTITTESKHLITPDLIPSATTTFEEILATKPISVFTTENNIVKSNSESLSTNHAIETFSKLSNAIVENIPVNEVSDSKPATVSDEYYKFNQITRVEELLNKPVTEPTTFRGKEHSNSVEGNANIYGTDKNTNLNKTLSTSECRGNGTHVSGKWVMSTEIYQQPSNVLKSAKNLTVQTSTKVKSGLHEEITQPTTTHVHALDGDISTNICTESIVTKAPDQPPVADTGKDVTITLPTSTVTLDGSASHDDHAIVSYLWQKVSPAGATVDMRGARSEVLTVSKLTAGEYVFGLTVTDDHGQRSHDTVKVTVNAESSSSSTGLCAAVTVAVCSSNGFTHTVFPNLIGQENQTEAEASFNAVTRSINNQLCQDLAFTYMCSVYFPVCDPATGYQKYPCKKLCEDAVNICGDYFHNPFPCEYFMNTDCVAMTTTTPAPATTTPKPSCERTLLKDCRAIGFLSTRFPNHFYEPNQQDAIDAFNGFFRGIISGACHKDVLYFLCSIQFPKCANGVQYKPCRHLCQEVTSSCPDIALFFDCNSYPEMDCVIPPAKTIAAPRTIKICAPDQFECERVSKCVHNSYVCNGANDCGDWSDEMDCVCNQYQFRCDMGMCIKSFQRCDGTPNCPDNSDEHDCDGCTHGQLMCPSGKCIMAEWLCDGRAECEDAWDESNCDTCGRNQFMCKDEHRTCIPLRQKCDGHVDCSGGFDEFECISDEYGMLQLPLRKGELPVCAASWDDLYGNFTCDLLGRGSYINKTDVDSNMHTLLSLSPTGNFPSVLGAVKVTYDCPGNKAVRINCEQQCCGKRMVPMSPYIVNGEKAKPGAWPWHAALYFGNQYFCGGTLINHEFVLTAAHCVERYEGEFSLLTVKLGANNRESRETTQRVVKVESIKSHNDHVYFTRNDIALLQLESPVEYTPYIQPACLPEPDEPLPLYSTCFTVGWGKVKWDGEYAEVLQQLKMTLWDTQKCNSSIAWNGEVYDTFLCAGYYSGIRSICKGDSGGPLICQDTHQKWKVWGVASYVANFCNMTERPNIYTDVRRLHGWIQSVTECKFRCDNGKCLYKRDFICDRVNNCGDNSDETRLCNRTVQCNFDDKFLCGYEYKGWAVGSDNKRSSSTEIDGMLHTISHAPQFDNTLGRYPGQFFYGKLKTVSEAQLLSPRFTVYGQTCVRFAFYLRGKMYNQISLTVMLQDFVRGTERYRESRRWPPVNALGYERDEWRTGYFDISHGEYQLKFKTGVLLKSAVDDVKLVPGMCEETLCASDEFWCRGIGGDLDKCIPRESNCNVVVDCNNFQDEEKCTASPESYMCTFENGNLCGLRQEVGDGTDWWLVNASFIQREIDNRRFRDHTTNSNEGHLFYISAYGIQSSSHIYMWQLFYLHSVQYCFSFYYQMRADVFFNIYVDCIDCSRETFFAQPTFEEKWTLFQLSLPQREVVNITYDVIGNVRENVDYFHAFIAMDDIHVNPGPCPAYKCPENYTKCRTTDRCIPDSAFCDRNVDCLDEFDEVNCECREDEFRCASGRCVPRTFMCDRTPQCQDGTDEGSVCNALQSVSCTFEHPYLCGYEFKNNTAYKWRRHQGQTPTLTTGPEFDHTTKSDRGHYLYPEANEGNKGDNASVVSPVFTTGYRQSLEFFYHIFSANPFDTKAGTLKAWLTDAITEKEVGPSWMSDPMELNDRWLRACVDLPPLAKVRAWFTALRTEQTIYGVDMAIDDVKLNNYKCDEAPKNVETAVQPTIPEGQGSCASGQWQCTNTYQCVPLNYRCDDEDDCQDGTDEDNCGTN
ncbi:uncharacterized protein LOC128205159 isoform X2 [Mya arenaria]|uniref:uncharacterized protein LOC128205159 isoform X2 n=1 Tax=Mya arenaria TaxID=6604 RepID=UPI0022DEF716|nr:uncharacterized protein LOC128205159 isoform X2 [Mya arenaria]